MQSAYPEFAALASHASTASRDVVLRGSQLRHVSRTNFPQSIFSFLGLIYPYPYRLTVVGRWEPPLGCASANQTHIHALARIEPVDSLPISPTRPRRKRGQILLACFPLHRRIGNARIVLECL